MQVLGTYSVASGLKPVIADLIRNLQWIMEVFSVSCSKREGSRIKPGMTKPGLNTYNRTLDFHVHKQSDEMFFCIEGKFDIEIEGTLTPACLSTVAQ